MSESKNGALLRSFTSYCLENPELRFWQALRNWSGHHFILVARHSINPLMNKAGMWCNEQDTFYWEGRDG